MDFYAVIRQAAMLLQQQGKLTYRTFKRQFALDDEALQDLKEELLFSHPVMDEDGRGLKWTGETSAALPHTRFRIDAETRFQGLLFAVTGLLRSERRVTYRTLKFAFDIDDALLELLRRELTFKQLAVDEDGEGLIWSESSLTLDRSGAAADAPEVMPQTPEAERRQLTVMFCDLVGSTDLAGKLDPEDLRDVVRAYQEAAAAVIERYEGHIAQYLGDGLLIYFGFPSAHEDDAPRAIYTGLGIPEAIAALNTRLQVDYGVQLAVRIGIHTGPVVVGAMGGGSRYENLALGETPNIAARLEGLAPANTVVISAATAQLARRSFLLEELGPHALKGVVEAVTLFRVVGPRTPDQADDSAMTRGFDDLVGRDEEIGLLLRRWQQSCEGLGQVVLLRGEAGIGKSSLVEGLRHHVRQAGFTRIAFRCSPYHANSAFYPIIEHTQRALGWQPDDTAEDQWAKLEQGLGDANLHLEEAVPLVASLLSIPLPAGRYAPLTLSSQQQRQHTQDVLVAWLLAEAERHPVLAVWEDLHWADPSTLETLGLLVEQAPTAAMLHVLTFRPEFEPPWPSRSHLTPITLNRLERLQAEGLVMRLAGGKTLPAEVVEHVVGKTDGVPLYIEELTKMLLKSDLLREEAGQYALTGPLASVAIPDTLQDSLMARLDQMHTAKDVAQLGSVLGREFTYEMLRAISSQDDETLEAGLAQLAAAELIYQRGRPPRATYIFKHALIQDAAYASLLRSARQRAHQKAAQQLEARFPEMVAARPELAAHHYTEAGLTETAIGHWRQAGQRASDRSAHQEAMSHLTTGLDLIHTLPETLERHQQELPLQTAIGTASLIIKGYGAPEAEAAYTRAYLLCQQLGETQDMGPVLLGLWRFYVTRSHFAQARQLAEELLSLAERKDEPSLYVVAHSVMGASCMWMGELRSARRHLQEGAVRYRLAHRHSPMFQMGQDPGVACRAIGAWTLWLLGYPDQALVGGREALELAAELDHPFSYGFALDLMAVVYQVRRQAQDVYDHADAAIILCAEQVFVYWLAQTTCLQGWALISLGQREQGLAQMRQGLRDLRATGADVFVPYFLTLLAEGYGDLHRAHEGLDAAKEALALIERIGGHVWKAEAYRLTGELRLQQATPDIAQAEICFRQALDIAQGQHAKSLELRAATSLARLWQGQGRHEEAHNLLAPIYHWFTEGFDTADLQEAKVLLEALS